MSPSTEAAGRGRRFRRPLSFVKDDPTAPNGWLVTPDDEAALAAAALTAATTGPTAPTERATRATRATTALAQVRARFTWQGAAHHVAELYDQVSTAAPHPPRG